MRITIITIGSMGDVLPSLALGLGLSRSGHDVRLATHHTFQNLVIEHGLKFAPVEGDIRSIIESGALQSVFETGRNPLLFSRRFMRAARPLVCQSVSDMLDASGGAELIILAGIGFYGGYDVALKLGIPFIQTALQPVTPTHAFQNVFFPSPPSKLPFKGKYNLITHNLFNRMFWLFVKGPLDQARREILDLPPAPLHGPFRSIANRRIPMLYGYSPIILPKPEEWDPWLHVTGYWFLDQREEWQPSMELVEFLNGGDPPVYVGFGSLSSRDPKQMVSLVLEVLSASKQRGVLHTGWSGLSQTDLPDTVFSVDFIPHDWLFTRVAAVIHHGGAGTTAAGLRAGVPAIIIPSYGDQYFWGQRVADLGIGPKPIPRKRLTADSLTHAVMEAVSNPRMLQRAGEIGVSVRSENGVNTAVDIINQYLESL